MPAAASAQIAAEETPSGDGEPRKGREPREWSPYWEAMKNSGRCLSVSAFLVAFAFAVRYSALAPASDSFGQSSRDAAKEAATWLWRALTSYEEHVWSIIGLLLAMTGAAVGLFIATVLSQRTLGGSGQVQTPRATVADLIRGAAAVVNIVTWLLVPALVHPSTLVGLVLALPLSFGISVLAAYAVNPATLRLRKQVLDSEVASFEKVNETLKSELENDGQKKDKKRICPNEELLLNPDGELTHFGRRVLWKRRCAVAGIMLVLWIVCGLPLLFVAPLSPLAGTPIAFSLLQILIDVCCGRLIAKERALGASGSSLTPVTTLVVIDLFLVMPGWIAALLATTWPDRLAIFGSEILALASLPITLWWWRTRLRYAAWRECVRRLTRQRAALDAVNKQLDEIGRWQ
jgi:hypothetical protein